MNGQTAEKQEGKPIDPRKFWTAYQNDEPWALNYANRPLNEILPSDPPKVNLELIEQDENSLGAKIGNLVSAIWSFFNRNF